MTIANNKNPRIIYFLNGAVPTDDDLEALENLGTNVVFRNAQHVAPHEATEACAGVAGCVPEAYEKLPKGEDVIKAFQQSLQEKKKAAKVKATSVPSAASSPAKGAGAKTAAKDDAGWSSGTTAKTE